MRLVKNNLTKSVLRKEILREINYILKHYEKKKLFERGPVGGVPVETGGKAPVGSNSSEEVQTMLEPTSLPGEANITTDKNGLENVFKTPEEETRFRAERVKCADQTAKEIERLNKIHIPGDTGSLISASESVASILNLTKDFLYTGAKNLIEFVSLLRNTSWEEKKRALNMMKKDLIWVLENDPETATCFLLDLYSVPDPTGLADISQGIILVNRGDNFMGAICLLFGLYQLATSVSAASTEGALLPLAVATKVEILSLKLGLKTGKNAIKIIEMLANPTLAKSINRLRQSGNPEYIKAASALEKASSQARRYQQFGMNGTQWYARAGAKSESEVLEKILNGKLTNYNPGISDAARFEIDKILRANKPPLVLQAAMTSVSAVSAASIGREKQEKQQEQLTNKQIYNMYQNTVCSKRPIICQIIQLDINSLKLDFKDGVDLSKYGYEADVYLDIANAYLGKIIKQIKGQQFDTTMKEIDNKLSEFEKENYEYYSSSCKKYAVGYTGWRKTLGI